MAQLKSSGRRAWGGAEGESHPIDVSMIKFFTTLFLWVGVSTGHSVSRRSCPDGACEGIAVQTPPMGISKSAIACWWKCVVSALGFAKMRFCRANSIRGARHLREHHDGFVQSQIRWGLTAALGRSLSETRNVGSKWTGFNDST